MRMLQRRKTRHELKNTTLRLLNSVYDFGYHSSTLSHIWVARLRQRFMKQAIGA